MDRVDRARRVSVVVTHGGGAVEGVGRRNVGWVGFGISGPLVKVVSVTAAIGALIAVASVEDRAAMTVSRVSVDEDARIGVRLSLLHWRSACKGSQEQNCLLRIW